MKIKLDENLPGSLGTFLKLRSRCHTLQDEMLLGHSDVEIWEKAQLESRFLITQDLDFSDSRQFAPGSHHGILLMRLRSPNRKDLIDRVGELFQKENVSEWTGCFVVATERKIRVLKPTNSQDS
jgi:predicted nuclease of predicted toxin-antitoxin system